MGVLWLQLLQLDMASGVLPSPFKDATLRSPLISTQSAARLTNTKQAQLPSEERVGDVLRDSEEVLAVYSSDAVELVQLTRHMATWRHDDMEMARLSSWTSQHASRYSSMSLKMRR